MGHYGQPWAPKNSSAQPDPADPDIVEWKWKGKTFYSQASSETQMTIKWYSNIKTSENQDSWK